VGGRGGSGPAVNIRPSQGDPAGEFWSWANGHRPINVDYLDDGRVYMVLPDANAFLRRQGGTWIVYREGDDKTLFTNSHSIKGLWNEISHFYGGRVEVSTEEQITGRRGTPGTFGKEYGRKTSAAARLYQNRRP
jgi:hypothetical protein